MHRTIASSLALGAIAWTAGAGAQELDTRWYLSPNVTHVFEDDDRNADNDWGIQAMIGRAVSDHLNLELNLKGQDFDLDAGGDVDQRGVSLDGLFFFNRNPSFAPYFLLGAGGLHNDTPGDNEWNPTLEAGLGFWRQVDDDGAQFRAEVRHRMEWVDDDDFAGEDDFNDTIVSLGFVIPIGARPQAAPAPRPRPEPVAAQPAPEPTPPPRVTTETFILEGVNFCFDCDTLSSQAKAVLDGNARKIIDAASPNALVEVGGHTDAVGSDEYNRDLSQRRAGAVRDYLVEQGVDGKRLSAVGYGESRPVADNDTPEGRARNRRVELRVSQ
jgi:OmpA-OmpF porin, OOP family